MDNGKKPLIDQFTDLSKKSLIKIQYSCGGNSTGIEEEPYVPIVKNQLKPTLKIEYNEASVNDVVSIIELLKENNLPVKDLSSGKRIYFSAKFEDKLIGCVAIELYESYGLLRSLAVKNEFRNLKIGKKLVSLAESWSLNNDLEQLFLLTTTADVFFTKAGWQTIDRTTTPNNIQNSTEFSAICPSSAICKTKKLR